MSPGIHNGIWMAIAALLALAVLAGTSQAALSKHPISFGPDKPQLLGKTAAQVWSTTSAAVGTRSVKHVQVAYRRGRYRSYYGGLPYYYGGINVYRPRIYYPRIYVPRIYYPRVYVPNVYVPRVYRGYVPRVYGGYRYR